MKKLFKIIFYLLIILILLAVIGAVLLATMVDPNKLKGEMSSWVSEHTGRQLTIKGDIERTFFPWLGVKVNGVTLSNAPGFVPQDKFLEVGEADLQIKLFPLLKGKLEVGKLNLKGVNLNLSKNQSGQTNWADLMGDHNKKPQTQKTQAATQQKENWSFFRSLSIQGVDIQQANVLWVDDTKKQTIKVSDFNFKSHGIASNEPFPVSMKFKMTGSQQHFSGNYEFNADVTVHPKTKLYEFNRLKMQLHLPSTHLPAISMNADKLALNMQNQQLDVADFMLSSGSLSAKGKLNVEHLLDEPTYAGHLEAQTSDFRSFLKAMGKEFHTQDPKTFQNLSISANFRGSNNSLRFDVAAANLDLSSFKGHVDILSFAPWKVDFDLNVDQLDLNRYQSVSKPQVASQQTTSPQTISQNVEAHAQAASSTTINFKAIREASLLGNLKIGTLNLSNTQLMQANAQLMLQDGVMDISPLTANLYGGTTQGQIRIDFRSNIPSYVINQSFAKVNLADLTKSDRLMGLANLHTNLTTRGISKNMILGSLNGDLQFDITQGAFKGINIPYEIDRAIAVVKKQTLPPKPENNQTDFGKFIGTGTITQGILSNNDLLVESPQFKMTGHGTANFVSQGLNYRVSVLGMHTVKNMLGQDVQEPRQTEIPLLITGTFSKPIVMPDVAALAPMLLKKDVQEKINENFENAKEKAGQILQQILK